MYKYTVYCHILKIDGRKYYGITSQIPSIRWGGNGCGYSSSPYFFNAVRKYGWDNFEHKIIHSNISSEEAKSLEIYYIDKYDTNNRKYGFNMTAGGDGVHSLDIESINKIIDSETIPVVQLDINGNFIKEYKSATEAERILKIKSKVTALCCKHKYGRKTNGGYIWVYKKDYEQNTFDIEDYKHESPNKPIIQLDLNGNIISKYNSARECGLETNISYKLISQVIHGEKRHTKGFVFIFDDEDSEDNIKKIKNNPIRNYGKKDLRLLQISILDDNIINVFDSAKKAQETTHVSYKNISRCICGKSKTAGGFKWKYID